MLFQKKITAAEKDAVRAKMSEVFPEYREVTDKPVIGFMQKWLSVFAPDLEVTDAKAFCLPRRMYENHLWHAFSFEKTDCYMGALAKEAFSRGLAGMCYLLFDREQLLFQIPDGGRLTPEMAASLGNVIVTDGKFSATYVNTGKENTGPYFKDADGGAFTQAEEDEPEPEEAGFVPEIEEEP